ncbi:hypothetical protein JOC37_002489 [Desulfohalotomaculum tongense]|uniref:hypothetical protein n=1 Tax=Desulforadius tongensis TaxID=1216062 RepID=UPI0019586CA2|nr:hypothetical protein [Desulforadius tongensis]MBM7856064.1 hypothetical protein [Desulforadius tongensis]
MGTIEWYSPRNTFNAMISKNHITLGELAVDKLNSEYAILGYDKETNSIAIKAVNKGEGFKITRRKINAKNFLKHFNINVKGTYPVEYDEENGTLLVKLD